MTFDAFRDIAKQFKNWRDENGHSIRELGFFSWWREPDYHDDYRELWELEQELSSPERVIRFELLSIWRLARDAGYARAFPSLLYITEKFKAQLIQLSILNFLPNR